MERDTRKLPQPAPHQKTAGPSSPGANIPVVLVWRVRVQSIVAIFDYGEQDPRSAWLNKMRQVSSHCSALLGLTVQTVVLR